MREIKFRAWFEGSFRYATAFENIRYEYPEDMPIMQYTGLKDKNGKEIYEGDIVKGAGEHQGQSNVFWGHNCYQPFSYLNDSDGENYEIIGNLYENPELLKNN